MLFGDSNGRAKYSNSQIIDCFNLLISTDNLSLQEIADLTGVSRGMVTDISCCNSHGWLKRAFPDEYKYLESIKGKRQSRFYYPVKSPSGEVIVVTKLTDFCNEYGLDSGNASKLLRGVKNTYKGWTVVKPQ